MADVVHQLVATERALDKLAARGISADEPPQLRHDRYVVLHNRAIRSGGGSSSARRTAAAC